MATTANPRCARCGVELGGTPASFRRSHSGTPSKISSLPLCVTLRVVCESLARSSSESESGLSTAPEIVKAAAGEADCAVDDCADACARVATGAIATLVQMKAQMQSAAA